MNERQINMCLNEVDLCAQTLSIVSSGDKIGGDELCACLAAKRTIILMVEYLHDSKNL